MASNRNLVDASETNAIKMRELTYMTAFTGANTPGAHYRP